MQQLDGQVESKNAPNADEALVEATIPKLEESSIFVKDARGYASTVNVAGFMVIWDEGSNKMKLERGKELAEQVIGLLGESSQRVEIAGGIRREKPEPHDMEIVSIPRFTSLPQKQLKISETGEAVEEKVNLLHLRICQLVAEGTFKFGKPNKVGGKAPFGNRIYRLQFGGEQLDIFVVLPPAQWGVVFTMRTGDAAFTQRLMSAGWRYGLHFNEGHLEQWMTSDGKPVTTPKLPADNKFMREVVNTPEEEDVFRALKLKWTEPKDRIGSISYQGESSVVLKTTHGISRQ